jgi:hypothetical protein
MTVFAILEHLYNVHKQRGFSLREAPSFNLIQRWHKKVAGQGS